MCGMTISLVMLCVISIFSNALQLLTKHILYLFAVFVARCLYTPIEYKQDLLKEIFVLFIDVPSA